jgi:hypothetical protein
MLANIALSMAGGIEAIAEMVRTGASRHRIYVSEYTVINSLLFYNYVLIRVFLWVNRPVF